MLLVEIKHLLRARFATGGETRFGSIEATVVIFLIPDKICPQVAVVVLLDSVDLHQERVPGIVVGLGRCPGVRVDVSEANGEVVVVIVVVVVVFLKGGGTLATLLLLLLYRLDCRAGGLPTAFLTRWLWFLDFGLGFAADFLPVCFEDLARAAVVKNARLASSVAG